MSKKIIAVAALLLVVTVLFAACKDKEEYTVSHTVSVGTTVINVYEDKEGNEFITNVDGDYIPVTSSPDGFFDDFEMLMTETTTKKGDTTTTTTTEAPSTTTTTQPTDDPSAPDASESSTVKVEIGGNKQDVIEWDDIINA